MSKIQSGDILAGINPYNHKKRKYKFIRKIPDSEINCTDNPFRYELFDYKENCVITVTMAWIKEWNVKKYYKPE